MPGKVFDILGDTYEFTAKYRVSHGESFQLLALAQAPS